LGTQAEDKLTYLPMSGTLKYSLFPASILTLTSGQPMNSNRKITIVMVLVISCCVVVFTYFVPSRAEPGTGLRADATCRKLLAEGGNREALGWLQESKLGNIRTIGEQDPEESLRIVQSLYNSGAVTVRAVKIDREAGYGETTNIICVELPVASSARQKLFKIEAKTASNGGFDPVSDDGQTYLFLFKFKLSFSQIIRFLFNR
jgi:hypothetical protein